MEVVPARLLSAATLVVFLAALPGCATSGTSTTPVSSGASPRQECRRMRGAAAARGIAMAVGAVVVVGVVVVAVAASGGGNPNFGGSGSRARAERRQARRSARAAVCSDDGSGPTAVALAGPASSPPLPPPLPETPDVVDVPDQYGGPEALSLLELQQAIAPHVEALRACAPGAEGTLFLDARIDGYSGRVTGIVLRGPLAGQVPTDCVSAVSANIETRRFAGVVDVRWQVGYPN